MFPPDEVNVKTYAKRTDALLPTPAKKSKEKQSKGFAHGSFLSKSANQRTKRNEGDED